MRAVSQAFCPLSIVQPLLPGIGGAEHTGAIVDIFRSNACALEDLSEDCSYEYEREHKRMFEAASSALKHLPSAAVSPHFQQLLTPLEREERTSRRREVSFRKRSRREHAAESQFTN